MKKVAIFGSARTKSESNLYNVHNFPLDLAAAESAPVALTAPAIG
jgi:hypothetical protein